ncbi:hypothetical protein UFOVP401_49 [uncultured Caudovirales phage]|uniref:Uncharacterized protein n=1 Tax=uncultured Caudovirales phage TaxID=2100421 RepID=A0A6J5M661_9CAUD|nr:hypothetical protein UFOVP401_49 [uncultured Caudovirales phage]
MELNITLSSEAISNLKSLVASESTPLFATNPPSRAVAEEIMENHGNDLVNGIVDQRGSDLAGKIAAQIHASEVASYIDMGDLAREIDIDHDEVARIVADSIDLTDIARDMVDEIDMDDVVGRIDMDDLASRAADEIDWSAHINHKQIALQLVTQFVNNKEFRDCFVDSIVERLSGITKS